MPTRRSLDAIENMVFWGLTAKDNPRNDSVSGHDAEHMQKNRYESIVAFRGIAALAVLMLHVVIGVSSDRSVDPWVTKLRALTDFGVFGVDLFFVISGYCISVSVSRFCSQQKSAWLFGVDRLVRIFPLFWMAFMVSFLLAGIADMVAGREPLVRLAFGFNEWIAHLLLLDVFAGLRPAMDVTWTLSHELAFYFMAGVGILVHKKPGVLCVLMLVILAAIVFSAAGHNTGWLLPFRFIPEFMCGVGVYAAVKNKKAAALVTIVMCAAVGFFWIFRHSHTSEQPGFNVFTLGEMPTRMSVAVACAMLLIALYPWDIRLSSSRFTRPLAFCGRISFSLYLIHIPVTTPVINGLRNLGVGGAGGMWMMIGAAVVVAILMGWLFHEFVESPLESLRKRLIVAQRSNHFPAIK